MKVSIVGAGYVGLVTGVCLAEKGHQVTCIDSDVKKVSKINQGNPPIYEKGLEELLRKNINTNFQATTDLYKSVADTDTTLISVGTPFNGNEMDLTDINAVCLEIGKSLKHKSDYHVVVVKSTVIPGTTEEVILPLLEKASGKKAAIDFGLGMNPEFLTEGEAVQDFMVPDRIVLGGIDKKSLEFLEKLYAVFEGVELVKTNVKTAEMIKYASNSLLATAISFSNELANLCSAVGGVDITDVMRVIHSSKYLSPELCDGKPVAAPITSFLWAGCGFGGSCLPKDVKALIAHGRKFEKRMDLLDAVIRINEQQPLEILHLLKKHFPSLKGINVTILGLAFRPDTSDMRESPAIPIINSLLVEQARIKAYDPAAEQEAQKVLSGTGIEICDSLLEAMQGAQAIVLVTRWEEFRKLPHLISQMDPQPLFVDGRRMLEKRDFARYEGIGL